MATFANPLCHDHIPVFPRALFFQAPVGIAKESVFFFIRTDTPKQQIRLTGARP